MHLGGYVAGQEMRTSEVVSISKFQLRRSGHCVAAQAG